MGKLIYLTNMSLDGYIEDEQGNFDLFPPDDEVFAACTDLIRSVGTFLYGRRLYETMAVWETDPGLAAASTPNADFAEAWQAADRVVYSTTLTSTFTDRTRLERGFDAPAVRALKETTAADLAVGGANLAAQAFEAGLVDECQLLVWPWIIGGGKRALPQGPPLAPNLLEEHRFGNGVLLLRYGLS